MTPKDLEDIRSWRRGEWVADITEIESMVYGLVDELDRLRAAAEALMHSEAVWQPKRARAAIIRAMVDVLEDEGLVVLTHSELDELMRAAVEAEAKVRAEFVVTKAEEAAR